MTISLEAVHFDEARPRRTRIHILIGIPVLAAVLAVVLVIFVGVKLRDVQSGVQCKGYLKQMGLALHNYHDTHGSLPPVSVSDASGRPRHSWRISVLPYIDRSDLYESYRFDEPWNGPRNSMLHTTDVPNFQCPIDRAGQPPNANWTSMVAIVGPHTVWPADGPVRFADVSDGLSNTILLAEVHHSGIRWLEPRDLHVIQLSPTVNAAGGQGISSPHAGGGHVLFGDGSARLLPDNTSADVVRRLIECDDGEPVGEF